MPSQQQRNAAEQEALSFLQNPVDSMYSLRGFINEYILVYNFAQNCLLTIEKKEKENLLDTVVKGKFKWHKGAILAEYSRAKLIPNRKSPELDKILNTYNDLDDYSFVSTFKKVYDDIVGYHEYLTNQIQDCRNNIGWKQPYLDDQQIKPFRQDIEEAKNYVESHLKEKYSSREKPVYEVILDSEKKPNKITVRKDNKDYLVCYAGKEGPPQNLKKDKQVVGNDADAMVRLGRKVLWIVRTHCVNGAFNNRLKPLRNDDEEFDFWNWNDNPKPSKGMRCTSSAKKLRWFANKGLSLWLSLRPDSPENEQPANFLWDLAANGMAAYLNQGGVCAQLSHLTMGLLTLLAPAGTEISLVYHKVDHSFVVISKGQSTWFVVDPWAGYSLVCPWHCSYFMEYKSWGLQFWNERFKKFEDSSILSNFTVKVIAPVEVPYGFTFTQQQIDRAQKQFEPWNDQKWDYIRNKSFKNKKDFDDIKRQGLVDRVWSHNVAVFPYKPLQNEEEVKQNEPIYNAVDQWFNKSPISRMPTLLPDEWGNKTLNYIKIRLDNETSDLDKLKNDLASFQSQLKLFDPLGAQVHTHSLSSSLSSLEKTSSNNNTSTLLNGIKILFDRSVSTNPVNLTPKDKFASQPRHRRIRQGSP